MGKSFFKQWPFFVLVEEYAGREIWMCFLSVPGLSRGWHIP